MPRASKICPRCPNLQPCTEHGTKPWASSQRRERTISGSAQQRRAAAVMHLHDGVCHACGRPGADQVDHVIPLAEGGDDTMDNLRPIHAQPCHVAKTQAEAERARSRQR
jgi:5-methylcytosine-specific restriction protein A